MFGEFLFLALLMYWLVPELLGAVLFVSAGHSLSPWLLEWVGIFSMILTAVFLFLAVWSSKKGERNELPGKFFTGLFSVFLTYLIMEKISMYVFPILPVVFPKQLVIAFVIAGAVLFVFLLLESYLLYRWLTKCVQPERKFLVKNYFRCFGWALVLAILFGIFLAVPLMIVWGMGFLPWSTHFSVKMLKYVLIAAAQAAVAFGIFKITEKMNRKQTKEMLSQEDSSVDSQGGEVTSETVSEAISETVSKNKRKCLISAAILGGICMLILGVDIVRENSFQPIQVILNGIENRMAGAQLCIAQYDFDGAVKEMEQANETIRLWKDIAGVEENGELERLLKEKPNDTKLVYLTALANQDPAVLENYLRVYVPDPQMALALLDLYETQEEELTPQQKVYYDQAVRICVEAGVYSTTWLRPEHVKGSPEKLEAALKSYESVGPVVDMMSLMMEVQQNGKATDKMVSQALELAEAYPDTWMIQYIAGKLGSELTYDGAKHYDRTATAIINYERLYREENKLDDTQEYQLRLTTGTMLINCYHHREALDYLLPLLEEDQNGTVYMMVAECYGQLEESEQCYEMSVNYLKQYPENPYALYYAALGALKLEKTDETIEYLSRLADLVKKSSTEEAVLLDTCLYSLLQFFAVNDNTKYTGYNYQVYTKLTEEQIAKIQENEFLDSYLKAVYYGFVSTEENSAQTALEMVENVLNIHDGLPNAWYLKGAILFGTLEKENIEKSVEAYKKSLSIEPNSATVWYALANAYADLEQYELCVDACNRTLTLLPEMDHGEDWYGLSIHCQRLYDSVKNKVK